MKPTKEIIELSRKLYELLKKGDQRKNMIKPSKEILELCEKLKANMLETKRSKTRRVLPMDVDTIDEPPMAYKRSALDAIWYWYHQHKKHTCYWRYEHPNFRCVKCNSIKI